MTPQVHARLVAVLSAGNYREVAAESVGIGKSTLYRWLEQGEAQESGPYRDLWEALKKAEAEAEQRAVKRVTSAFGKSWQAAMTFLERRHPERWSRRDRFEHTGKDGGPIEATITRIERVVVDPAVQTAAITHGPDAAH